MPRKEQTPKKKTPKKKTKEKSPKRSEDPKMDEAEINRLLQNALDEANARAEQKLPILISESFIPTLSYPGRVTNKLVPWYQLHYLRRRYLPYGTCKLNR